MHEEYTVLTPLLLGGTYPQLLAACLPSTLLGIPVSASFKVTESTMYLVTMHLPARLHCDLH